MSNISVMQQNETVLDMIAQISRGEFVLDLELAVKDVITAQIGLMEKGEYKKGSVSITLDFDPDAKSGAMRVSGKLTKKVPEKTKRASLFFALPDGTLTRTDPHQHNMFVENN